MNVHFKQSTELGFWNSQWGIVPEETNNKYIPHPLLKEHARVEDHYHIQSLFHQMILTSHHQVSQNHQFFEICTLEVGECLHRKFLPASKSKTNAKGKTHSVKIQKKCSYTLLCNCGSIWEYFYHQFMHKTNDRSMDPPLWDKSQIWPIINGNWLLLWVFLQMGNYEHSFMWSFPKW